MEAYRKIYINMLERVQKRLTKIILKLRDISYEMTRRLRGDQIEVFKILHGYENIDRNMFSQLRKREGLEDTKLH